MYRVLGNDTTQALDLTNLCKCIRHERKRIRFYWLGYQRNLKEYLGYDCPCVSSNIPIHPCCFYGAIFYSTLGYLSRIVGGKLNLHWPWELELPWLYGVVGWTSLHQSQAPLNINNWVLILANCNCNAIEKKIVCSKYGFL